MIGELSKHTAAPHLFFPPTVLSGAAFFCNFLFHSIKLFVMIQNVKNKFDNEGNPIVIFDSQLETVGNKTFTSQSGKTYRLGTFTDNTNNLMTVKIPTSVEVNKGDFVSISASKGDTTTWFTCIGAASGSSVNSDFFDALSKTSVKVVTEPQ
jgi:hypothetical protein